MDDVSIIAGGPSAKRVDLAALPGTIIGVNDSAIYAPRVDIVFSVDRNWIENRLHALEHMKLPTFLRLSAMRNVFEMIREPWVFPFQQYSETSKFGKYQCMLNGPSSGHCAVNLAYVWRPKRIHLVGFDGGKGGHWHPKYPWEKPANRPEWEVALQDGIRQCKAAGIEVVRLGSR